MIINNIWSNKKFDKLVKQYNINLFFLINAKKFDKLIKLRKEMVSMHSLVGFYSDKINNNFQLYGDPNSKECVISKPIIQEFSS